MFEREEQLCGLCGVVAVTFKLCNNLALLREMLLAEHARCEFRTQALRHRAEPAWCMDPPLAIRTGPA